MRQVMVVYHGRIAEVIAGYQGTVARYMGDGVLAYFGYPQAHEDDAEQALRAGLALVDAVPNLQTRVDVPLQVRVGIATGIAVVGDLIGEGASQEQAVVGDTPNLAARLQALAEPGTVVISASTRRLTAGHFEYRDLGAVEVKGWAEPIMAWQVLRTSGVESRFEAQHDSKLTPLFGRDEEIDLLLRRWRLATQGEGRVVVLTGDPGIGKSHIALALQERLQAEPHTSLHYFCSAHYANSALFPFIGQLERAARFKRGNSPAEKLAKLETLIVQSTVDGDQTVALLANLLSLPPSDRYRLPELSPQSLKSKTLAALLAQFECVAATQPVLMIFEDVHWIDPTSLELLTVAVDRVPQLRVLLIITARPQEFSTELLFPAPRSPRGAFSMRLAPLQLSLLSNQVHLAGTKGQRMSSSERLTCNPRQYHAAHPHQCFVCRRTFSSGIRHTHEDTGAKTCSSTCVTLYERWWLRKRQEVQAVASTPNDAEAR